MSTVPDDNPYAAPTAPVADLAPVETLAPAITGEPAGAWRRLLARALDVMPLSLLVGLLLGIAAEAIERGGSLRIQRLQDTWLGLLMLPIVLLLEGLVYAAFGTTAGKWLCGLRVVDVDQRPLRASRYFGRLALLWVNIAGGIPYVGAVLMLIQGVRVARGKPTTYDTDRAQVLAQPMTWVRIGVLALVIAIVGATVVRLSRH